MGLIRPSALWFAAILSLPAFFQSLILQTLDVTDALIRFLVAVPVAALLLAGFRYVTFGYGQKAPVATGVESAVESAPLEGTISDATPRLAQ
ncbi:hypothetical protein J2S43_006578 [Catenuloplanes nepalensis]|uniref:Uncharacterized protein n=1 Tax=Catenuloplanes nepalensis TaxID=587533 RepID=A0ABT9N479_9ACTN|nr:hypothetical protein [Catenuloplanes nepalensis]MDP9798066.1 hypothetical protein [Catenuloplanes nepalensis]